MIEKVRQDLETNRQIIRQIRVDDRSKSIGERDVIRLQNPTEDKKAFQRMLTSADLILLGHQYGRRDVMWNSL